MPELPITTSEEPLDIREVIKFLKDYDIYEIYGTTLEEFRSQMVKQGMPREQAIALAAHWMMINRVARDFDTDTAFEMIVQFMSSRC